MYVCMYVCIYMYMYIYVYVYIYSGSDGQNGGGAQRDGRRRYGQDPNKCRNFLFKKIVSLLDV